MMFGAFAHSMHPDLLVMDFSPLPFFLTKSQDVAHFQKSSVARAKTDPS